MPIRTATEFMLREEGYKEGYEAGRREGLRELRNLLDIPTRDELIDLIDDRIRHRENQVTR